MACCSLTKSNLTSEQSLSFTLCIACSVLKLGWIIDCIALKSYTIYGWIIDSRVTGIGNSINTLFVFVLFHIVPMVNHPG